MNSDICDAINNQNIISFIYDQQYREVEPHCYGVSTKGNELLRAFQIAGYSSSGKMGWKLYDLSKTENIQITDGFFDESAFGYKRGDSAISTIYCEI